MVEWSFGKPEDAGVYLVCLENDEYENLLWKGEIYSESLGSGCDREVKLNTYVWRRRKHPFWIDNSTVVKWCKIE